MEIKGEEEVDLGEAFRIAVRVHGSQRDKGGEPYMGHLCRVMSSMKTDTERCVAILHDAIEDGGIRARRVGHRIYRFYGATVGDAVIAMTRNDGEVYQDYIKRLKKNPLAVKTKLADLRENLAAWRLGKLPSEQAYSLKERYLIAWLELLDAEWIDPLQSCPNCKAAMAFSQKNNLYHCICGAMASPEYFRGSASRP